MINFRRYASYALDLLFIIIFIVLVDTIGFAQSILLYALLTFTYLGYKTFKSRDLVMGQMRTMEATAFGKPLDKKLWKKGELASKKVKVVWKKPEAKG